MKKLLNEKKSYVIEMLEGLTKSVDYLEFIPDKLVVYNKNADETKVNLISGGGAGHEPAHGGFVGEGMLSAAISGNIFSSPTPDQIMAAIEKLGTKKILLVVKNYTGDVMNFKIAAELANAKGKNVEYVIVDDDVAVENSTWTDGKRGVAGTLFVHKIAGAAAHNGKSLSEVKTIAEKVIKNIKTIGIALEAPISPDTGTPSFDLEENKFEFGIGIHGEPGIRKEKIKSSKEIVSMMVNKLLESYDFSKSEVAVLVNGMGGTPLSELYISANDVLNLLETKSIKTHTIKIGDYMTSLDMKGFSITLLKLDEELKKLLDDSTEVSSW